MSFDQRSQQKADAGSTAAHAQRSESGEWLGGSMAMPPGYWGYYGVQLKADPALTGLLGVAPLGYWEHYGMGPVQRRADQGAEAGAVHAAATHGLSGSAQSLPHLDRIQQAFGSHDVSGVQAHVGGPAAEASRAMGAVAYATEGSVAFRESPDLHTAAHEAAHVVQQRAGVHLKGGVGEVGDVYERQADAAADAVVAGRSAQAILDGVSGGGQQQQAHGAVQRQQVPQGGPLMSGGPPTALQALQGTPSEADIERELQQSPVNPQQVLDLLRRRPVPTQSTMPTQLDALIESNLSGDARWRARNIRLYGPEDHWPPILRGDTAAIISHARGLITSGTAPQSADAVADALRPLNPTALHQVITLWRAEIPAARFGGAAQRTAYFDSIMTGSSGPRFAPAQANGPAPILDLETRSEADLYAYFQRVASVRGFTFSETDLSNPRSPLLYTAFNIRGYEQTTTASSAAPHLNARDFTGRLFLVWRDPTGQHVRNWQWSNTGIGGSKLGTTHQRGDDLLASEGHTQGFGRDARGQVSAADRRSATGERDATAAATAAATVAAQAQAEAQSATRLASQATAASAQRANAGTAATGTRALADSALDHALQARRIATLATLHADRAIRLIGRGTAPTGVAAPQASRTTAQAALQEAQAAFNTARDAWLIARQQQLSTDEESARQAWERAAADPAVSEADRRAARQRYDQAQRRNNSGLGEGNTGQMSEQNALPWLQEGQYVARLRDGEKGGEPFWSVNAGMEAGAGSNGYAPVDRDWNADGQIQEGERDVPGTAMGTGVLIHRGDNTRWSIGCQVAPADPYHEFVQALSNGGSSPAGRFAYIVVEAQHLPPWSSGGAAPGGGAPAAPGGGGTP